MRRRKRWLSVMLTMGLVAQSVVPASAAMVSGTTGTAKTSISQRIATDSNGSKQEVGAGDSLKGTDANAQKVQKAAALVDGEISFTQDELTMYLGDADFSLSIKGSNSGKIIYESDKPNVAEVTSKGKIRVKGPGVAKITATDAVTGATATMTVTVPERELVFTESPIRVRLGDSVPIPLVKKNFSNVTIYRRVLFEIQDETVADMGSTSFEKETIRGLKLGTTKLTVKSDDGFGNFKQVESSCNVEVYTDVTISNLKVESAFKKSVVLSWKMENTPNYRILRSENGAEYREIKRGYDGGKENTYVDTTAKESVTYKYKIEAMSEFGWNLAATSNEVSVTVSNKLVSFRLPTLYLNESYQIKPEYTEYTTIPKGTWTMEDTTIATVDSNGLVKALKEGQTKITFRLEDGNFHSANLWVTKPQEVKNLVISYNYDKCVKLSWEPINGYDTCAIYRREGNGAWSKIGTTTQKTFADETAQGGAYLRISCCACSQQRRRQI